MRRLILLFLIFAACAMNVDAATVTIVSTQGARIGDVPTIPNGVVTPPQLLAYTSPVYTDAARARFVEGSVILEVAFDIEGNFTVFRVLEGLGFGLDETALAAIQGWRFTAAARNDVRIPVIARVEVRFSLSDSDLYQQSLRDLEQGSYTTARLFLQRLINIYPNSRFLSQAKFGLAETFYREGSESALRQAESEYEDYLTFFPNTSLSGEAQLRRSEIRQRLAQGR